MSSLKINFEMIELLLVQRDDEKMQMYADMFNCQIGTWPIKYLGTPVCARRTSIAEMKFVEENIKKGVEGWMGNQCMSIGGRVTKIDACLSNSVVYQISLRLIHKTNIEGMEKPIRYFMWAVLDVGENIILSFGNPEGKEDWVSSTFSNLVLV
jgi:hypothetical protein